MIRLTILIVAVFVFSLSRSTCSIDESTQLMKKLTSNIKYLENNVSALWTEVSILSRPVHVHVHHDDDTADSNLHHHDDKEGNNIHHHHPHGTEDDGSHDDDDDEHMTHHSDDRHHNLEHDHRSHDDMVGKMDHLCRQHHGYHHDVEHNLHSAKDHRDLHRHHHTVFRHAHDHEMSEEGNDVMDDLTSSEVNSHQEEMDEDVEDDKHELHHLHEMLMARGTHVHVHLHTSEAATSIKEKLNNCLSSPDHTEEHRYAFCDVKSGFNSNVSGLILMRQTEGHALEIRVTLEGFHVPCNNTEGLLLRGLHGHEYGDVRDDCKRQGSHYNPLYTNHGGPSNSERHLGDFGNLNVNNNGTANVEFVDYIASLFGSYSLLGRGIVIHEAADDLGKGVTEASKQSGNSGARIACCAVVASDPHDDWTK